jgi:hypothetical protein
MIKRTRKSLRVSLKTHARLDEFWGDEVSLQMIEWRELQRASQRVPQKKKPGPARKQKVKGGPGRDGWALCVNSILLGHACFVVGRRTCLFFFFFYYALFVHGISLWGFDGLLFRTEYTCGTQLSGLENFLLESRGLHVVAELSAIRNGGCTPLSLCRSGVVCLWRPRSSIFQHDCLQVFASAALQQLSSRREISLPTATRDDYRPVLMTGPMMVDWRAVGCSRDLRMSTTVEECPPISSSHPFLVVKPT